MVDITTIPQEELEKDLRDSLNDIEACEFVLLLGIETYSQGIVQRRLEANQYFVKVITAELERRKGENA